MINKNIDIIKQTSINFFEIYKKIEGEINKLNNMLNIIKKIEKTNINSDDLLFYTTFINNFIYFYSKIIIIIKLKFEKDFNIIYQKFHINFNNKEPIINLSINNINMLLDEILVKYDYELNYQYIKSNDDDYDFYIQSIKEICLYCLNIITHIYNLIIKTVEFFEKNKTT